ncbi:hypothetical protein Bbelb_213140 [Branchiostoma belcheri]|nr:hypothetical protein Bbelb_213140 [Branchiostoma belcheri]
MGSRKVGADGCQAVVGLYDSRQGGCLMYPSSGSDLLLKQKSLPEEYTDFMDDPFHMADPQAAKILSQNVSHTVRQEMSAVTYVLWSKVLLIARSQRAGRRSGKSPRRAEVAQVSGDMTGGKAEGTTRRNVKMKAVRYEKFGVGDRWVDV